MRFRTLAFVLLALLLAAPRMHAQALVQVSVLTGDDDLRGGNSAFLEIHRRDSTLPEVRFSTGARSNTLSSWTFRVPVLPTPFPIFSVILRHDGNPRPGEWFDSYDAWDVRQITIAWVDANGSVLETVYNSAADSARFRGFRLDADHRKAVFSIATPLGEPDFVIRTLEATRHGVAIVVENAGDGTGLLTRVACFSGRWSSASEEFIRLGGGERTLVTFPGNRSRQNVLCLVDGRSFSGLERVTGNNVARIVVR